jgi:hypothetical protein
MTIWKDLIKEISDEARRAGKEAVEELKKFQDFFREERVKSCEDEQPCLMDAFFRHQQTLPPSMRSTGAMLVCPCRRCNLTRM